MHDIHTPADVLFILLGAVLILAMHAGFAFLELGTVRSKNQINALVKIPCDFAVSTLAYFLIGYGISYVCGAWGGVAAGIFGTAALGGIGGVSILSQLIGTAVGIAIAFCGGALIYGAVKLCVGLRLSQEDEYNGADLSIHRIGATPEPETR